MTLTDIDLIEREMRDLHLQETLALDTLRGMVRRTAGGGVSIPSIPSVPVRVPKLKRGKGEKGKRGTPPGARTARPREATPPAVNGERKGNKGDKILAAIDARGQGFTAAEIIEDTGLGVSTVSGLLSGWKSEGLLRSEKTPGEPTRYERTAKWANGSLRGRAGRPPKEKRQRTAVLQDASATPAPNPEPETRNPEPAAPERGAGGNYKYKVKAGSRLEAIRLFARQWGDRQWSANDMLEALKLAVPDQMDTPHKVQQARFALNDLLYSGELKSVGTGGGRLFTATKNLANDDAPRPASAINVPRDNTDTQEDSPE